MMVSRQEGIAVIAGCLICCFSSVTFHASSPFGETSPLTSSSPWPSLPRRISVPLISINNFTVGPSTSITRRSKIFDEISLQLHCHITEHSVGSCLPDASEELRLEQMSIDPSPRPLHGLGKRATGITPGPRMSAFKRLGM